MNRRILSLAALSLALGGCRSVYSIPAPARDVLRQEPPPNAFVIRTKRGEEMRLGDVTVRGDSLVGLRSIMSGETVTIALADVESIGKMQVDIVPTIIVMLIVIGGTLIAFAWSLGNALAGGT